MTRLELRPRLATEIVDAAFQLYRRHFGDLVTLSALAFVPVAVLQLLLLGGAPLDPTAGDAIGAIVILIVGWVIGSLLEAAIVVGVSNSYLHGAPDVGGALRHTVARLGAVLFAIAAKWFLVTIGFLGALIGGAIVGGFALAGAGAVGSAGVAVIGVVVTLMLVLLSIPVALYFYASFFAVPATVVLEGLGVRAGLRRSRELSHGQKVRIIGTLGIPMLLFLLFRTVLGVLASALPGPPLIGFLVDQGTMIIAYPIMSVIATLLYYDTRIRKEGFDIEIMAAELEPLATVQPSESPPSNPA